MAIISDYPRPITVNGYVCRNCDDVSKAKKFEDPAGPKLLEFSPVGDSAVSFGGTLTMRTRTTANVQLTQPLLDRFA